MTKEKKTSQTSMGARWNLNLLAPPHSQVVRDEQSAKWFQVWPDIWVGPCSIIVREVIHAKVKISFSSGHMTCLAVLQLSVNHTEILLDSTVEKHNSSIHPSYTHQTHMLSCRNWCRKFRSAEWGNGKKIAKKND